MARIEIDGRGYEAGEGDNLLSAILARGLRLPFFCWHPALGAVGACRQCAVKELGEGGEGRLVMACMTAVTEGLRLSIDDPEARAFRAAVIEWLMVNHPHDCPVCDEGGECHLQDMTVMTGHLYRRYRFPKRTFENQYLGPFIHHEMNRCIACYRCVRFYQDYAGGRDLQAFASKDHVYFGREGDGVLESPFSGNLVEVCPTGVFTDATLARHYTRKWDLQSAPSLCVHCGVGCNTFAGERYGVLRRVQNRYHRAINGHFLCDRGRFGYEFVNREDRPRRALLRSGRGEPWRPCDLEGLAGELRGTPLLGIGSPRASLEANYALRRLVGEENFFSGMSGHEQRLAARAVAVLRDGPIPPAAPADLEEADALLVLGEDLEGVAPRLALSARQALRQAGFRRAEALGLPRWQEEAVRVAAAGARSPLFVVSPAPTALDGEAAGFWRLAPGDVARFGFAVAARLRGDAPSPEGLPEAWQGAVAEVAEALAAAARPLVLSGIGQGEEAVVEAAANIAWALKRRGAGAGLLYAFPECNSVGAALFGAPPLEEARGRLGEGTAVIVLENDLSRRLPPDELEEWLAAARWVVVDHLAHPLTREAHCLLPSASFVEGDGTLVNGEGRAQRHFQVFVPGGEVREGWRWLRDLGRRMGREMPWEGLAELTAECARAVPGMAAIGGAAPERFDPPVPRQGHRFSGRTAISAPGEIFEPAPPRDQDAPLAFSMEGFAGEPPPALLPRHWKPGWNSPQAAMVGPRGEGEAGVRLFGPRPDHGGWFAPHPPRPQPRWIAVPLHHPFGSEEQSALAPGIASLAPAPYLALGGAEARALGVAEGGLLEARIGERRFLLPARIAPLAAGVVGLPVGIGELHGLALPAAVELTRP